jgi:serine/threonine protein phosphatase PrpC
MTGCCDGAATAVGRVRRVNEDSYLMSPPLYAVADGMGGHGSGDVASALAIDALQACARLHRLSADVVLATLYEANRVIVEATPERGDADNITVIVVDVDQDAAGDRAAGDDTIPRDQLPGRA